MRVQQEGKAPFALNSHDYAVVLSRVEESTVIVLRMAHRIWKESKQQPGTAEPGNMLGCCLISFYFLWAILSMTTVHSEGLQQDCAPLRCISYSRYWTISNGCVPSLVLKFPE